jgi:hypothetical protein
MSEEGAPGASIVIDVDGLVVNIEAYQYPDEDTPFWIYMHYRERRFDFLFSRITTFASPNIGVDLVATDPALPLNEFGRPEAWDDEGFHETIEEAVVFAMLWAITFRDRELASPRDPGG